MRRIFKNGWSSSWPRPQKNRKLSLTPCPLLLQLRSQSRLVNLLIASYKLTTDDNWCAIPFRNEFNTSPLAISLCCLIQSAEAICLFLFAQTRWTVDRRSITRTTQCPMWVDDAWSESTREITQRKLEFYGIQSWFVQLRCPYLATCSWMECYTRQTTRGPCNVSLSFWNSTGT